MIKKSENNPEEEEEIDSRLIEEDLDEADKEKPKKRSRKKKISLKSSLPTIKEEDAEHQLSSRSNVKIEKDPEDQELNDLNIVGGATGEGFTQNISPF